MKQTINTVITFLILASSSFSPANGQTTVDKLEEYLAKYHEVDKFNGSVLVADNGKIVHKGGNGWANMEWDIKNESDTKHRLGSITKQFTSMLVLQLMEEGKVKLDIPITTYIPDYPSKTGDIITLHHLMTHTSGIPNYTSFPGFFKNETRKHFTPKEFLTFFQDSTLNFKPGSDFDYSNSGYFLLGYIIEEVTGNSYEEELQNRIFDPLEMKNTGYDHHENILKKRATGYEKDRMSYVNSAYLDMSIPYAAGSMYSTAEDLYLWDQALYSEQLISEKTKALMFDKHTTGFGGHYGYGWSITDRSGETEIAHGGGINGFNTIIARFPESKDLVVLLNNTGGTNLSQIAMGIKAILDDKPYELPKRSIAKKMLETIKMDGIDKGIALFEKHKKGDEFEVSEEEINAMGYQLLSMDKIDEAVKIFKLNTEQFPESWNVYDSYGEGLLASGDKQAAIVNYKKSVKMNPANDSGLKALERMGVDVKDLVKEVVVDDAILASYVGKYELQAGFVITISKDGSQLSGQATGQPKADIFPKSDTEFYLKVVEAQIVFNKNADGEVDSLTLIQGGQEMPAKKVE